jgi:RNA polymerase sigma-70 factor (ECF subfamily)
MDEQALIQSALKGDMDAFNRLVLAFQDMAYNTAYRIMGESVAADDATQEAFISIYQKLHTYRGGSFKAWILRIVTNACYDELRRRQRRPVTALEPEDDDGELVESPKWMEDTSPTPDESMDQSELDCAIQHCLDGLDENFRTVVVLVDGSSINRWARSKAGLPVRGKNCRIACEDFGNFYPPTCVTNMRSYDDRARDFH